MYKNLRKQLCKEITKMDDHMFILHLACLDMIDTEIVDKIIDFKRLKDEADKIEKNLEKKGVGE